MIPDRKPRFKVVKRRSRCSAIIHGSSKYGLKYLKGDNVWAPAGTLGIFTFKTDGSAWDWADVWNHSWMSDETKDLTVIEVIPLGRGKHIIHASPDIDTFGLDYFYREEDAGLSEVPDNTYAYPGVYVCE